MEDDRGKKGDNFEYYFSFGNRSTSHCSYAARNKRPFPLASRETILEGNCVHQGIFNEFQSYLSYGRANRWIYIFLQCKHKFMPHYERRTYFMNSIYQTSQRVENLYIYSLNEIYIYINPMFCLKSAHVPYVTNNFYRHFYAKINTDKFFRHL